VVDEAHAVAAREARQRVVAGLGHDREMVGRGLGPERRAHAVPGGQELRQGLGGRAGFRDDDEPGVLALGEFDPGAERVGVDVFEEDDVGAGGRRAQRSALDERAEGLAAERGAADTEHDRGLEPAIALRDALEGRDVVAPLGQRELRQQAGAVLDDDAADRRPQRLDGFGEIGLGESRVGDAPGEAAADVLAIGQAVHRGTGGMGARIARGRVFGPPAGSAKVRQRSNILCWPKAGSGTRTYEVRQ
jgi:hypothetical protein